MAKISLVCDQCGGGVEVDDGQGFGVCPYCRSKLLIKNDTIVNQVTQNITKTVYGHQGKDVEELVVDGNKLREIGDEKNANFKFKNAVDVDPKSWDAWFGYASTGGDKTETPVCVSAYKSAYNVAADENQQLTTFTDMTKHLTDKNLGEVFVKAYKETQPEKRQDMFNRVLSVIGCVGPKTAQLATELCSKDWRAWFALAKVKVVRVRWCERKLGEDEEEILAVFVRAYTLAERDGATSKQVILSHFADMERDESYKNFLRAFYAEIGHESEAVNENVVQKLTRGVFGRIKSIGDM